MIDELIEIRKEVAFRRYKLTGCTDSDMNWREAGKILMHFLDRRPECSWWKSDDEDYGLYRDIIYGTEYP